MKLTIEIGWNRKPKPEEPETLYMEMHEGKPRYIVTENNMYEEGYIRQGSVNGVKRWQLKIYHTGTVLAEVRRRRIEN